MNPDTVYSDKLVEMTAESIRFKIYYFAFGSKRLNFSEVGSISIEEPTLLNGKYRFHGTGDFMTWFPCDWKRHARDKIFLISFPSTRQRIGFTVENSGEVEAILQKKGLIASAS